MSVKLISAHQSFGGRQLRYEHTADSLGCDMYFSIYLPPAAEHGAVPAVFWLSGLTCTDENFVQKAGAQAAAATLGVAVVAPDTSPRGESVPDDPDGEYDFGLGAGFYVNATEAPWSTHYKMYDYCLEELPALVAAEFPVDPNRHSICGHSMGGHGALVIALRNPQRFCSVSAFAPIASPIHCPWGEKALGRYLGADQERWRAYDACALIEDGADVIPMRVDQGGDDDFLEEQLQPQRLREVCDRRDYPVDFRLHPKYDHSYFFVASFIQEHLEFHASHLQTEP